MTCIECGGQMKSGPVELSGRYRGTELRVEMPRGFACGKCEYKTIHGRDMGEFRARLKDAYRQKSQRLTPKQVKQTRISLGASRPPDIGVRKPAFSLVSSVPRRGPKPVRFF